MDPLCMFNGKYLVLAVWTLHTCLMENTQSRSCGPSTTDMENIQSWSCGPSMMNENIQSWSCRSTIINGEYLELVRWTL